jgi:hypothetical protein
MPSIASLNKQIEALERSLRGGGVIPDDWAKFVRGCVIRSGSGLQRFEPYLYQLALVDLLRLYNNVMVVKTRQIGLTQTVSSTFLHKGARSRAFTGLVFLPTQDDVSGVSRRIGEMIERNRWGLKAATDNVKHLQIAHGGNIYFRGVGGKSAARGTDSVNGLIFDESAFYGNRGEPVIGAAMASTALTGEEVMIINLSTPDVSSGMFYDGLKAGLVRGVEETCDLVKHHKLSTYNIPGFYHEPSPDGRSCVIVIHHSAHPVYGAMGRDEFLAYRQSVEKVPMSVILREYDLVFNSVGSTLLNAEAVRRSCNLTALHRRPMKDPLHEYYAGIDGAAGGEDYCVCIILRRHRLNGSVQMVSVYREHRKDSQRYLHDIRQMLKIWRPVACTIETNGIGKTYYDHLAHDIPGIEFKPFHASGKSKIQMFAQLAHELEANKLSLWGKHPIESELLGLIDYGAGQIRAGGKGHDDLAFALAFAIDSYYDTVLRPG